MSSADYILFFVAGLFAANGIPNYIKGITGSKHQTPFGNPSNAVVNVIWGSLNFAVAAVILHYITIHNHHVIREAIIFAAGAFIVSLLLAHTWSRTAKK